MSFNTEGSSKMLSSRTVHNRCSSTHLSEPSIVGRTTVFPQRRARGADAPRYRLLVMLCTDLYTSTPTEITQAFSSVGYRVILIIIGACDIAGCAELSSARKQFAPAVPRGRLQSHLRQRRRRPRSFRTPAAEYRRPRRSQHMRPDI